MSSPALPPSSGPQNTPAYLIPFKAVALIPKDEITMLVCGVLAVGVFATASLWGVSPLAVKICHYTALILAISTVSTTILSAQAAYEDRGFSEPPPVPDRQAAPARPAVADKPDNWAELLQTKKPQRETYYNLASDEPMATVLHGFPKMPFLGRYDPTNPDYAQNNPYLGIRLHDWQLTKFPVAIQEHIAEVPNRELYFMVLKGREDVMNMVFHTCAYDCTRPQNGQMNILMAEPEGIEAPTTEADFIKQTPTNMRLHYHDNRFSPNNAKIQIEEGKDVSSLYVSAILPGRKAVACFVLIVNDPTGVDGQLLVNATEQENIQDFIEMQPKHEVNTLFDSDLT